MPYSGSTYTRAGGTTATAGQAITATMHETEWEDLKTALNKLPPKDAANTFTANQKQTITDAGALFTSATFTIYRNSASPAAADGLGGLIVSGNNASGSEVNYGAYAVLIADTTAGSEDGVLSFKAMVAGSLTNVFNMNTGFYYQGGTSSLGTGTVLATHLGIVDGVTAPSTVSGVAQIYVDSADGDLKVKFGDGTVKTISTDT